MKGSPTGNILVATAALFASACTDQQAQSGQSQSALALLEISAAADGHWATLDAWAAAGGDADGAVVDAQLIQPCSELVLLYASPDERRWLAAGGAGAFERSQRSEVCVQAAAHQIHPQGWLVDPTGKDLVCGSQLELYRAICRRYEWNESL